jgi:hypothetical protein
MIPCAPFQTFERIAERNIDIFVRMIGTMTIALANHDFALGHNKFQRELIEPAFIRAVMGGGKGHMQAGCPFPKFFSQPFGMFPDTVIDSITVIDIAKRNLHGHGHGHLQI